MTETYQPVSLGSTNPEFARLNLGSAARSGSFRAVCEGDVA